MKHLWLSFVCLFLVFPAHAEDTKQPYIPPAKALESISPKAAPKSDVAIPEPSAEAIEAGKNTPAPTVPPSYDKVGKTPAANAASASGAPTDSTADAAPAPQNPLLPDSAYIKPTWPDMLHTLVRFNALDFIKDDRLIDEYAQIAECDLYLRYYQDDFKWNQIRGMIRESLKQHSNEYPVHYYKDIKVQLGRYNFEKKLFEFAEKSVVRNVNAVYLLVVGDSPCVKKPIKYIANRYRGVTNEPITITGLSIEQQNADALLTYLTTSKNTDRILLAQFNMTVGYIQPLDRVLKAGTKGDVIYEQTSKSGGEIRLDVKVDSVDFFADPEKRIKVYTYVPP